MRSTLMLLAVACAPAFCQNTPEIQISGNTVVPEPMKVTVVRPANEVCSIPLLNVVPPGKPVPMPTVAPHGEGLSKPDSNLKPVPEPAKTPGTIDKMSVVAPAPACPASISRTVAPLPLSVPGTVHKP